MVRRYAILDKVGFVVMTIGVLSLFLSMSIDLDVSPKGAWLVMLLAILVSGGLIALGHMLSNFSEVEGFFFSCCVVVGAWLYKVTNKRSKSFKQCYSVYRRCKTYVNTFTFCRDSYAAYVDSLYNQEVSNDVE